MSTDIRSSYSPNRFAASTAYALPHHMREYSPHHRVVREMSPARTEVHTVAPVVEKVFEKSTVIGAVSTDE